MIYLNARANTSIRKLIDNKLLVAMIYLNAQANTSTYKLVNS